MEFPVLRADALGVLFATWPAKRLLQCGFENVYFQRSDLYKVSSFASSNVFGTPVGPACPGGDPDGKNWLWPLREMVCPHVPGTLSAVAIWSGAASRPRSCSLQFKKGAEKRVSVFTLWSSSSVARQGNTSFYNAFTRNWALLRRGAAGKVGCRHVTSTKCSLSPRTTQVCSWLLRIWNGDGPESCLRQSPGWLGSLSMTWEPSVTWEAKCILHDGKTYILKRFHMRMI